MEPPGCGPEELTTYNLSLSSWRQFEESPKVWSGSVLDLAAIDSPAMSYELWPAVEQFYLGVHLSSGENQSICQVSMVISI